LNKPSKLGKDPLLTNTMKPEKVIEIDGRTGEGGGQLVRIAVAIAATAGIPIQIVNVRGNREGRRGGGKRSDHPGAKPIH